jgi:hypothetical protein
MPDSKSFWQLTHLSDRELVEGLDVAVHNQRQSLAAIIAHLGEVEERRIHLRSAHASMFCYCVSQLGMSEDEACRRIELARLARRFPMLYTELDSGQISLSVALLLKPILSSDNHRQLLTAARGASMRVARELIAAYSPRPDVASSIRKLPERQPTKPAGEHQLPVSLPFSHDNVEPPHAASPLAVHAQPPASSPAKLAAPTQQPAPQRVSPRQHLEPLAPQRYRIQFTADSALKAKLEQARDLLRHAHPGGDFAPVVSRALDLLIEDVLRRRFGAKANRQKAPERASKTETSASSSEGAPATPARARQPLGNPSRSRYISRAARRALLQRDGLACSWVNEDGSRCGSQAWLEIDHERPLGKGGDSDESNLRLLCAVHNQHAAEQAYGRQHIDSAIERRRRSRDPT